MKLRYKFICKDLDIPNCDFVAYGNRKRDIIKRVEQHLIENGVRIEEITALKIKNKIKSAIRESKYV